MAMAQFGAFVKTTAGAVAAAYRRVPVRWRLGGGSAALTLVILTGFAVVTDVLTNRQLANAFYERGATAVASLTQPNKLPISYDTALHVQVCPPGGLYDPEDTDAAIRVFSKQGRLLCSSALDSKGNPINSPSFTVNTASGQNAYLEAGYRVNVQQIDLPPAPGKKHESGYLLYALPLSSLTSSTREVRILLIVSVLGGAILALLAGLLVAQRAMRPIADLTAAAREIERTRDPSRRLPQPEADDEVAELARTLESMLDALDAARNETEAALARQREFVADASHELRTPLTSVLANLELLADELDGEQSDSANAALRSTRRMRRLVADLLLLARADVGRVQPRRATDLAEVLTAAAGELSPSLDGHELTIDAASAPIDGLSDDLHRLILNLLENAIRHTPSGSHINASTAISGGHPTLIVQDDGPGIAPNLQARAFERFVRGGGDAGHGARGTGLGLAIVDAVAAAHQATVTLDSLPTFPGTRFTVVFQPLPGARADGAAGGGAPDAEGKPQTSTTTGRTIGRRRSRS